MLVLASGLIPLLVFNEPNASYESRNQIMGDTPLILWLHNLSDVAIGLSCFGITAALLYVAISFDGGLPFRGLIISFATLLLMSAMLHSVQFLTTASPAYGVTAGIKWMAAIASIATSITLPTCIPKLRQMIDAARNSEEVQAQLVELTAELEQRVAAAVAEQRKVTRQLLLAQQEERKRLSIDIHDGLTQTATAHFQQLQVIARRQLEISRSRVQSGNKPAHLHDELQKDLHAAISLAQQVVTESRNIIEDLRPAILDDFGIQAALRQKCEQLNTEGWNVNFHSSTPEDGYKERPSREHEGALYRVFQETLTNIRKHARASRVDIQLNIIHKSQTPSCAQLIVTDNGIGFTPADVQPHHNGPGSQIGLASRKELVEQLGGQFHINSAPGRGTTIITEIPMDLEEEE